MGRDPGPPRDPSPPRDPGPLPAGTPRDTLVATVATGLTHLPPQATVVVACSGGPDSTALAYLAAEARPDLDLVLTHVAHGLRDDRADRATVEQHAAWLGARFLARDVEVVRAGRGTQAAAREARYAALRAVAAETGATAILVGHTATDQAETLLLRLARGTGVDGLAGMAPVHGDLTRPLLRLRRADVRRFVDLDGLPYVDDPTNVDPTAPRSVVRHEVLAALARAAPDPVAALARLAELARDDATALHLAAAALTSRVRWVGPVAALADEDLRAAPPAVARRAVREVLERLTGLPPTAHTVTRVLALPSGGASLPMRIQLTVAAGWRALAPGRLPTVEPIPLAVPGTSAWEPAGLEVEAITPGSAPRGAARERRPDGGAAQLPFGLPGAWSPPRRRVDPKVVPPGGVPGRMTLALPDSAGPLVLRHRAPGDRVGTPGGTRRVADVLIDAGLPRPVRSLWPVVAAGDRVVWVPGFVADRDLVAAGRAAPAGLLVIRRRRRRD